MTDDAYVVRHVSDVTPVPCPCGESRRVITRHDTPTVGLHVTSLGGARRHYHERTTEVYYILQGEGRMELGDDVFGVRPGHVIYIPPGVPHRADGHM